MGPVTDCIHAEVASVVQHCNHAAICHSVPTHVSRVFLNQLTTLITSKNVHLRFCYKERQ